MEINERLKKLRKSKGINQEQAAAALGVSLSSYQKYERDKNSVTPSLEVLIRIANFYGVTTDSLLGMPPKEPTEMELLEAQYDLTPMERKIMENYFKLPEKDREDFLEYLERIVNGHKGGED
ncbi:MAG: helix-turn-helix domain-containing protein [Lachnospiraceae bacterium]|nr:helix-turn-helix domain-containing protein [Ruminococcus sp.]MCM1276235.1 helix-turn-helix domain-containing protein [Lachnospiraceae bacterium]